LDSGILLATAQTETFTDKAKMLLSHLNAQRVHCVAPVLLKYEVISVVRKWAYRGVIKREDSELILARLLNYPLELHFDEALVLHGYQIAEIYQRPTAYDAQYLAVAERFGCDFWTADLRLFNSVSQQFPGIHWLGNFQ
jgi:predicted nucleic acid-binding protein